MANFDKILVPVDFSNCSKAALETGLDLACRLGSEVDIIHVWEIPRYFGPNYMVRTENKQRESLRDVGEKQAKIELDSFLESIDIPKEVTLNTTLGCGEISSTIVEAAKTGAHDLLVIGTAGRSGISHLLLGSIAEKVLRSAPCPVLTIREKATPA